MNPFSFPLWVLVNEEKRRKDGFPYFLLTVGSGDPTANVPKTLLVFSTESLANQYLSGRPIFTVKSIDSDTFYDMLKDYRDVEDVVIDVGTPNAAKYRSEVLLGGR